MPIYGVSMDAEDADIDVVSIADQVKWLLEKKKFLYGGCNLKVLTCFVWIIFTHKKFDT